MFDLRKYLNFTCKYGKSNWTFFKCLTFSKKLDFLKENWTFFQKMWTFLIFLPFHKDPK